MIFEIMIALSIGILAGIITGLTPGIHVNLVSVMLVALSPLLLTFTTPLVLAVFIISMSVTHTYLDAVPSIFLGAPDADMAIGVLPGHRMLLKGKGFEAVKLTVIGSLLSMIASIITIPLILPVVASAFALINPYMGYLLIAAITYMILLEKGIHKKIAGTVVFLISGILGLVVFSIPNLNQPLFAMLSGLFGISTLLLSLQGKNHIPQQTFEETVHVPLKTQSIAVGAALFSGSLTGMFPGLGSAQAAIIAMQVVGKIGQYGFLILVGGINTVNFLFSLATLYALEKARNGAIVAVLEIINSINLAELFIFLAASLIAGGIAAILALKISKIFAVLITKVSYKKIVFGITAFIIALTLYFNGILGIIILATATFIGMLPAFYRVKRSLAMGCILLPVILYFL